LEENSGKFVHRPCVSSVPVFIHVRAHIFRRVKNVKRRCQRPTPGRGRKQVRRRDEKQQQPKTKNKRQLLGRVGVEKRPKPRSKLPATIAKNGRVVARQKWLRMKRRKKNTK
jgi:hypothetical protein